MNPDQKKTLAKLHSVKPRTRQKMLARMTEAERTALTEPCPGEAHGNPNIDGCGCCLFTSWGRVLREVASGPRLTVTISGGYHAGKTTLALAFQRFLQEQGFTGVSVTDADVAYDGHHPELQGARMAAISLDRRVSICTVQEP